MDPFRKLKSIRTLLVDDDELIRDSISLAFANKGCFLMATGTAEEGLRALEKEHFDIVISDFRLPELDGLEFFKSATALRPNTLNILITCYRNKNIISEAFRIGIHDVIDKPFSVGAFVKTLALALDNGKTTKTSIEKRGSGMKRFICGPFAALFIAFAWSGATWAMNQHAIDLKVIAETEMEVINEKGEKELKRVQAAKVVPGDEVIFTIYYSNVGQETAENAFITNPIPKHMLYRAGTASGAGSVITFSVDGGKTYDVPGKLKILDHRGKERPAKPSEYTHIRWTFQKPLPRVAAGQVSFRAQLE